MSCRLSCTASWHTVTCVEVMNALIYLHTRSPVIVHGDLKPENIMVERSAGRTDNCCLCRFRISACPVSFRLSSSPYTSVCERYD